MKPKITVIQNDKQKDANYLCFLAKNITRNLYQQGGFFVLPEPIIHRKSVYFPDMKLSDAFWSIIKNTKSIDYCDQFPSEALTEVSDKLNDVANLPSNTQSLLRTDFLDKCTRFFGNSKKFSKVRSIQIYNTPYGTSGSWDIVYSKSGIDIHLTWRHDMPVNYLARTMLLAFYTVVARKKAEIGENYWYERKAVVDFLLKFSEISEFNITKQKVDVSSLLTKSEAYLKKLGFPSQPVVTENEGVLYALETDLSKVLSIQEFDVISLLYKNQGNTVSIDDIADMLWRDLVDEKYSLYAIAKVIENIRRKVRTLGVNQKVIYTVRGTGYVLR